MDYKNSYHYSKLHKKFFTITNDSNFADFICEMVKRDWAGTYKEGMYAFMEDYLTYVGKTYEIFSIYRIFKERFSGGVTKDKLLFRYGPEEGLKRWNNYCDAQAKTNTFEYKKEKYGWDQQKFDEYNASRAVTYDNLIRRHGKEEGTKVWNNYIERQKVAGCKLEYFVDKYGHEEGELKYKELNLKKVLSLDNFIKKYGDVEGLTRFENFAKNQGNTSHFSKKSQKFFELLMQHIPEKHHKNIFFATKNYEYFIHKKNVTDIMFLDFYDIDKNICIEYHGDYFHCTPKKYESSYFNKSTGMTALETWEKDMSRTNMLLESFNLETFIIWENEVDSNLNDAIVRCLKFLNYEC